MALEAGSQPGGGPPDTGFRSLPEVNSSVAVDRTKPTWRRWLGFAGPGFLVSVGYMDPGNWGTDLAGGSKFGYALLWVIFISNLMAQFLQVLCAKLGLVTGKDLAMACRDYYKRPAAIAMWILCEIAIIACDLAEVVGSAVALYLLFGIRLEAGVILTGLDVLILLSFMKFGFRKIEAIIFTLVLTIFGCFAYEIFLAKPDWSLVARGTFVPTLPNTEALLISVGILGATVMPHNLYLHSSIVQTRKIEQGNGGLEEAIKFNKIDTVLALSLAFFVNAAILILAAALFHNAGIVVEELEQGHVLLNTVLGAGSATAFAIALLASGQSSTITGTLAGQIVMEGFMRWRIAPWIRRLVTRSLAIIPAVILIQISGGKETVNLLVLSQVVLSMQLPFAIFPLVSVTSDKTKMGRFANKPLVKWLGYTMGFLISALNVYLLYDVYTTFQREHQVPWLPALVVGLILAAIGFAAYVHFIYKDRPKADGAAA
ncbi:MAG: Nramp family divalent metal transporter [Fimbriimonadaceae bacterium]|nr:Nramp family divalent metal transporter [Fimbriimonadaceae bacterium]QYK56721.1 MAG: Nramp family divalent metal transporter [Fimbriimonadaceae bacterium]